MRRCGSLHAEFCSLCHTLPMNLLNLSIIVGHFPSFSLLQSLKKDLPSVRSKIFLPNGAKPRSLGLLDVGPGPQWAVFSWGSLPWKPWHRPKFEKNGLHMTLTNSFEYVWMIFEFAPRIFRKKNRDDYMKFIRTPWCPAYISSIVSYFLTQILILCGHGSKMRYHWITVEKNASFLYFHGSFHDE